MLWILVPAAILTFLLLLWNLLHYYMEKKFQRSFGFAPPQSGDKYAIQALQPMVNKRLHDLADSVEKDKTARRRIVDEMSEFPIFAFTPFGRFTKEGKELRRMRAVYDRLTTFDLARGNANFFNFQVGSREDYL